MIGFVLALTPLIMILMGCTVLKLSPIKAGIIGTIVATLFCIVSGSNAILLIYSFIYGVLVIHSYLLAFAASFLLTFYMMACDCFVEITKAFKGLGGGKLFQAFFLNTGLAVLFISCGVNFYFVPVILYDLGFSAWVIPALNYMGSDPLSQFAFFAIPITVPTEVYGSTFGFTISDLTSLLGSFFFVTIPGYFLGMLWMLKSDGVKITKRHVLLAVVSGIGLALFINILIRTLSIMAVGIVTGLVVSAVLYFATTRSRKIGEAKKKIGLVNRRRLLRSISPLVILVAISVISSLPLVNQILEQYVFYIPVIADQTIKFKIFQPYVWILLSWFLSWILLRPSKKRLSQTLRIFKERAPSPLITYIIFAGLTFIYVWSGMQISPSNRLSLPPESQQLNLLTNLAMGAKNLGFSTYLSLVPWFAVFGSTVFGSDLSSTLFFTKFHFLAANAFGFTKPVLFLAGHIIANISIVHIAKITQMSGTIGKYGTEWITLRKTLIFGLLITGATVPILFLLL